MKPGPHNPVPETGGYLFGCGIALLLVAGFAGAVMVALEAR